MDADFLTFSNAFSWVKIYEFRLRSHWSLFPMVQLTISQHWFRQWLGASQATSHHLNQWLPSLPTHICVTRPQWFLRHAHDFIGLFFFDYFIVCRRFLSLIQNILQDYFDIVGTILLCRQSQWGNPEEYGLSRSLPYYNKTQQNANCSWEML